MKRFFNEVSTWFAICFVIIGLLLALPFYRCSPRFRAWIDRVNARMLEQEKK